jgi:acetoacetyl-CoA synthetase
MVMDAVLWGPSESRRQASALWRFALSTEPLHGVAPDDYAGLHRWSTAEPAAFFEAVWDFTGIIGDKGGPAFRPGTTIRDARFFPDARLNYAENLLRDPDDRLAIIAEENDGRRRTLTRRALRDSVSRAMQALAAEGVGKGDRVAALVSNDLEAAILYMATAGIGAIWASCSPDFGPEAAVDRLGQIEPAILLATPSYSYGNKRVHTSATIEAVAAATNVRKIILTQAEAGVAYCRPHVDFDDWVRDFLPRPISFERFPFDTPMVILFTSGTTGKPKAMVHSAGGLLLQHLKEHQLHCDLGPGDRLFYYTTCGWMMWNWQLSGLASGAALVTYDGNPFHPGPARLVELIDSDEITVFGTSAKYLQACEKAGVVPRANSRLATLRAVLSTGSPLPPESFDYVYRDWKADLQLASISGGSDICGCFLGGVPTLPVRRGELQAALLGMDVAVVDEEGRELPPGTTGELVCRAPHPSMPLFFWGDADGSRYQTAYFERFPGIWTHGDFVEARPGGGFIIKGRSDTTLNPGGVRIGTAEIYRQVETIGVIAEAVAVAQEWQGDQRIVLFVRLEPGKTLDPELIELIRQRIRIGATPRHLPAAIIAVSDIPRTRSGKISEMAVREAIHGRPVKNAESLANPESLALYADFPELKR